MGIPLLQSRQKIIPEQQAEQPPALLRQLNSSIDYCRSLADSTITLTWSIDNSLTSIERQDQQLLLPDLVTVFSCATLKKQLWEQIYHVYQ